MNIEKNWVLVGAVGKPHGIKGWIKIISYTQPLGNIMRYQPWYLSACANEYLAIDIESYQVQNQRLIVQFRNCENPEQARLFTNHKIYVERKQLAELSHHEYYWCDLEGLRVYTCENICLGVIQSLLETGANDVLVVQGEKRYLIPFLTKSTIKSIDLKQKKMVVDWDPEF